MTDDLSAPLGQRRPVKHRFPFARASAYLATGLLVSSLFVFAGWTFAIDDPLGGEPIASAGTDMRVLSAVKNPDETAIKVQAAGATDASISDATPPAPPPGTRMVTIIDGTSGRRQNFVVPEFDAKNAMPEDRMTDRSRLGLASKT